MSVAENPMIRIEPGCHGRTRVIGEERKSRVHSSAKAAWFVAIPPNRTAEDREWI